MISTNAYSTSVSAGISAKNEFSVTIYSVSTNNTISSSSYSLSSYSAGVSAQNLNSDVLFGSSDNNTINSLVYSDNATSVSGGISSLNTRSLISNFNCINNLVTSNGGSASIAGGILGINQMG